MFFYQHFFTFRTTWFFSRTYSFKCSLQTFQTYWVNSSTKSSLVIQNSCSIEYPVFYQLPIWTSSEWYRDAWGGGGVYLRIWNWRVLCSYVTYCADIPGSLLGEWKNYSGRINDDTDWLLYVMNYCFFKSWYSERMGGSMQINGKLYGKYHVKKWICHQIGCNQRLPLE